MDSTDGKAVPPIFTAAHTTFVWIPLGCVSLYRLVTVALSGLTVSKTILLRTVNR